MFSKVFIVAVWCVLAVTYAEPHVFTPVGPAVVTAQSSQVFARTYNGIVPFPIPAPVPAPVPDPTYHFHTPAFVLPSHPAPVFYPQPVVYNPVPPPPSVAIPVPVPVPVPAAPAHVVPTVVAAAAPVAAKVVAAPVAKVARLVRPKPFRATIRYRSVVA